MTGSRARRTRTLAVGLTSAALAVSLSGTTSPASAAPRDAEAPFELLVPMATARAGEPGADLVRQDGTLTQRLPGYPVAGTPAHRTLASASVDLEVHGYAQGDPTWFLGGAATLAEAPPGSDYDAQVHLILGHVTGSSCALSTLADSQSTRGGLGTQYGWVGYSGPDGQFPDPARPWDCAGAAVVSLDGATTYDVIAGPLRSTFEKPQVAVTGVELLGAKQKKLRLVRGVSTTITVGIRNSGQATARSITLTGRGSGLKVGRARLDSLAAGGTASLTLPVTLTRAKASALRVRVAASGTKATRKVPVTRVAPPRRPVAGDYRSSDGNVRFRVKGSRIVGWRGTMQQRCGGHGTLPTTTQVTLDFPRTRIPANGIVQAVTRGSQFSTTLRLRIVGSKVTHGLFTYADQALCRASVNFTARRR